MEWLWVSLTVVIFFCILLIGLRLAYVKGYRAGGQRVLKEWREFNKIHLIDKTEEETK